MGTPTANGACGACTIRAQRSEIRASLKKYVGEQSALNTIDTTPTSNMMMTTSNETSGNRACHTCFSLSDCALQSLFKWGHDSVSHADKSHCNGVMSLCLFVALHPLFVALHPS